MGSDARLVVRGARPLAVRVSPRAGGGGPVRAFPGAQGFARDATGGRGGTVLKVTNLNDTGAGSFRAAVTASGARHVIFEVSGTIVMASNIAITNPDISIWGQTAPSPGISLRGPGELRINTTNVIIQHLRLRIGADAGGSTDRDCITLFGNGTPAKNTIIVDHCSMCWCVDEAFSTGTYSTGTNKHTITLSNCIVSESLSNSIHTEGEHSKGILWGQGTFNVSMHRNLLAHHKDRNPWFKGDTSGAITNNIIYNYGGTKGIFFQDADALAKAQFGTVVGNVIIRGSNSPAGPDIRIATNVGAAQGAKFYMLDNSVNRAAPPADPWSLVLNEAGVGVKELVTPPVAIDNLTDLLANGLVEASVKAGVGARPLDRDAVDIRIVNDVTNGTGAIIDSPSQVGGWPTLAENTRTLTPPVNGTDVAPNGYTVFENWVHDTYTPQVQ